MISSYLGNYCFQKKIFNYKVAQNFILNNFVIENFSLKPLVFKIQGLLTDGHTDGRTARPSYRDARTHLKKRVNNPSTSTEKSEKSFYDKVCVKSFYDRVCEKSLYERGHRNHACFLKHFTSHSPIQTEGLFGKHMCKTTVPPMELPIL